MGMYTELVIKCSIKDEIPEQVHKILQTMFGDGDYYEGELPNHPFFSRQRWRNIGRSSSYYHIPKAISYYNFGYLFSRSDLKNYENEIDLFLDWLDPYIAEIPGQCIGWVWYEEFKEPTLVYKK